MHQPDEVERYLAECAKGAAPEAPDCVKRIKDEFDLHAVAGDSGWVVIALADGHPLDHVAYPSWGDACKAAKWNRDNYMFLELTPDGCPSYRHAAAPLHYARTLHRGGYRVPAPDWHAGPLAASMPLQRFDRARMAKQLTSGRPLVPAGFAMSNLPSESRKR